MTELSDESTKNLNKNELKTQLINRGLRSNGEKRFR